MPRRRGGGPKAGVGVWVSQGVTGFRLVGGLGLGFRVWGLGFRV